MNGSDADYFTAREVKELEMISVSSSSAAAKVHRELATRYRNQIDGKSSAAKKRVPLLAPNNGNTSAQTSANSVVQSFQSGVESDSQKAIRATSLHEIDERPDDRGRPVYIIMRDGMDVTSRWTRADADDELNRLSASAR